jgi:menaquinone-dependent protoporphyrinogen oxidase
MRILIAYATTDGQTRKIAQRVADICMNQNHSVEVIPAGEADETDLSRFDAAILAGSLHAGSYQKPLSEFAAGHARFLNTMPSLFLPVSLSAAGTDDADWKGLEKATAEFIEATGWKPGAVEHVAGAFRFSQYDVVRAFLMRRIATKKDPKIDVTKDQEYTDWVKLGRAVTDWLKSTGKP